MQYAKSYLQNKQMSSDRSLILFNFINSHFPRIFLSSRRKPIRIKAYDSGQSSGIQNQGTMQAKLREQPIPQWGGREGQLKTDYMMRICETFIQVEFLISTTHYIKGSCSILNLSSFFKKKKNQMPSHRSLILISYLPLVFSHEFILLPVHSHSSETQMQMADKRDQGRGSQKV